MGNSRKARKRPPTLWRALVDCGGDGRRGRVRASNGYEFVVDEVKPRDDRPGVVVEVATHGVADHLSQTVHVVSFGEDGFTQCPSDVATLGRLFDDKDELRISHAIGLWLMSSAA
jgi:hypothetical protein